MSNHILKLEWKKDQLFKGCILASIAHAIMVAHYPELSHEHSWDGMNYNLQDSAGIRGTITFTPKFCAAAFRNDHSERINSGGDIKEAIAYFTGAPEEVIKLAEEETLEYLLGDVGGKTIPLITTGFWGIGEDLFTIDTYDEMLKNGGSILERQVLPINQGITAWKEYYAMSSKQTKLLTHIYERKIIDPQKELILTRDEIKLIGTNDKAGLKESMDSFREMSIILKMD